MDKDSILDEIRALTGGDIRFSIISNFVNNIYCRRVGFPFKNGLLTIEWFPAGNSGSVVLTHLQDNYTHEESTALSFRLEIHNTSRVNGDFLVNNVNNIINFLNHI